MSGRCLKGVWKVAERQGIPRGCQEDVWKVSRGSLNVIGMCLEVVWKVSERCLEGVWKVSGRVSGRVS